MLKIVYNVELLQTNNNKYSVYIARHYYITASDYIQLLD